MRKAREEQERKRRFTDRGEVLPSELLGKQHNQDLERVVREEESYVRRSLTPTSERKKNQEDQGIVDLGFDNYGEGGAEGGEGEEGESQAPLLFVDVNLGADAQERIVVYAGDTAEELALGFCIKHDLDEDTQ